MGGGGRGMRVVRNGEQLLHSTWVVSRGLTAVSVLQQGGCVAREGVAPSAVGWDLSSWPPLVGQQLCGWWSCATEVCSALFLCLLKPFAPGRQCRSAPSSISPILAVLKLGQF